VPAEAVAVIWADQTVAFRTRMLGVTTRIRQQMPDLTVDQVELIDGFIREGLESLADEGEASDAA
jgi:phage terminase Nu1 subunit (DNA packaging protein)